MSRLRRRAQPADAVGRAGCALVDLVRVGTIGLRARRSRTALTALGIAIGIAAMVAVVGISASSRADLLAQLDALGTDLLRVAPGQTVFGETTTLPESARGMADRIGPVTAAAGVTDVDATVRRNDHIDDERHRRHRASSPPTSACSTPSAASSPPDGSSTTRPSQLPTVVLGADAAGAARHHDLDGDPRVWLGGAVVRGDRHPRPGAAGPGDRPRGADRLPGRRRAVRHDARRRRRCTCARSPTRSRRCAACSARRSARRRPNEVDVSRPSDALEARATTDAALRNLLLGLGAVALVVGGVGITNVMVISVLERRGEIGVRRALGARRRAHRRPVPGRGRRAGARSAASAASPSAPPSRRCTPAARAGSSTSRSSPSPAAPRPRSPSACSPASPPPSAPPASTPPTRSVRTDAGARRAQRATRPCCRRRPARRRGSAAGRGPARSPRRRSA